MVKPDGALHALKLVKVETIKVHHLVPSRHKIGYEFLLRIFTGIDFCYGPELGV